MSAVARGTDEPIPGCHRLDAVAEESARVPDLLGKSLAIGKAIVPCRIDERMSAPDAHLLVHPAPIRQADVCVVTQETGQRVADVRERPVLDEILRSAAAPA